MSQKFLKGLSIVLGIMFLYGCAATKGIEVRRYVEVKDRVDQNMEGNAGFLAGTPQPEDRSEMRKTRKVYVLEISKESGQVEDEVDELSGGIDVEEGAFQAKSSYAESSRELTATLDVVITPPENKGASSSSLVEYKVEKDDTLQKISKKFYGSYSKWPKIYEINKGVIDNPDRIKPGITIQIPMD